MRKEINISDEELVEHCLNGERQYQEKLYRKYADKMYGICLTYTKNEEEACDVLQDGFIKVFKNLYQFSFSGSLEGWIRTIIVNMALQLYNKKKRERENVAEYAEQVETKHDSTLISKMNAQEIIRLVNELPSKAAMVLKLYAIEGYQHKEIAVKMGIAEGTSKSQLNRARLLLKDSMSKLNG